MIDHRLNSWEKCSKNLESRFIENHSNRDIFSLFYNLIINDSTQKNKAIFTNNKYIYMCEKKIIYFFQ
jgi:hypothetical protein